jgi:glycosyltransferase involved in cell wall biosynthesis
MVMIEALASGTPVVATGAGSVPEIVEDGITGFIRRPDSLVSALSLVHLIDRHRCRQAVQERFSSQRMVEAHLHVYRAAIRATAGTVPFHSAYRHPRIKASSTLGFKSL